MLKELKHEIKHDGLLYITEGKGRKETSWKAQEWLWSKLVDRVTNTHRTAETFLEYTTMSKEKQVETKDCGGFLGGMLAGKRRNKTSVASRSIITLDIDSGNEDLFDTFKLLYEAAAVMYTTHSHSPTAFRARMLIPLDRPVLTDEYQAIARSVAGKLGIDSFDDTTFQPHRLMFWPSTSKDGEFLYDVIDGPWIKADEILDGYADWRDATQWPFSSRVSAEVLRDIKKQGDPDEKPGVIGAFCRRYPISDVVETFLSDVYEDIGFDNRYTYLEGSTAAGMVVYDDKFAYSHHGSDPVCGKLCNAFDLVRLHKFGLKDEDSKEGTPVNRLPSYLAMLKLCQDDRGVRAQLMEERTSSIYEDFSDEVLESVGVLVPEDTSWKETLDINRRGEVLNTLGNVVIVMENDKYLKKGRMNTLKKSIEIKEKMPWKRDMIPWTDEDSAQLRCYLNRVYGTNFSKEIVETALLKTAADRGYHPIRDYLNWLPEWDEVERLDTLFIDYLGAEDSHYIRAVTRKVFTAAVARVFVPGCKFDNMLVLAGKQGIGKSLLIAKMAMEWFSDSLTLYDTRDKTAAEKLQGYWILEIGELAGLRKSETETLKSFLSSQNDSFRASYGKYVADHPRQCIFIGTTNAEDGYLRDATGNRRFWPVKVTGEGIHKPWDLTQGDIDLLWAEAYARFKAGEKLYLDASLTPEAEKVQREAMESDEREGLVRDYLDTLLPENWSQMNLSERQTFLRNDDILGRCEGIIVREKVCVMEIWVECFGKRKEDLGYQDSILINSILTKIGGWKKQKDVMRFPLYGASRGYKKY